MILKKTAAFICAVSMMVTMAACAKQADPKQSSSLSAESGITSSTADSSSTAPAQDAASNAEPASSTAPAVDANAKVVSPKVTASKNKGDYQVKTVDYSYKKDNISYKASYPQLTGKIANLDKVNEALKKSALQTINSLGTGKKAEKTTLRVTGDVTFQGKNFLSAGYNEYTTLSAKAETTHVLRTVNINLQTGVSVGLSDMIVKSDALYKALEKAAKSQLDSELTKTLTADAIKAGLDSNAIYFTDTAVGFSVQIVKPEKRQIRITLNYQEAQPFVSKNANWSNFI